MSLLPSVFLSVHRDWRSQETLRRRVCEPSMTDGFVVACVYEGRVVRLDPRGNKGEPHLQVRKRLFS
jgi:hypothetical protein